MSHPRPRCKRESLAPLYTRLVHGDLPCETWQKYSRCGFYRRSGPTYQSSASTSPSRHTRRARSFCPQPPPPQKIKWIHQKSINQHRDDNLPLLARAIATAARCTSSDTAEAAAAAARLLPLPPTPALGPRGDGVVRYPTPRAAEVASLALLSSWLTRLPDEPPPTRISLAPPFLYL